MQRICYLYTDFQRIVFHAALLEAGLDETEFRFITHGYCNDKRLDSPTRIMGGFKKLEWSRARELIAEVDETIDKCADGQSFELWLASDNSAIGQILIHHPLCKRVVLFEDGLANYGVHYPLLSKKNIQIELFRLRNLALLWPHYRMPKRAGESPRALRRYALTEYSFPYSHPKQIVRMKREHFLDAVAREVEAAGNESKWDLCDGDLLFIDAFKDRARADARRPMIAGFLRDIIHERKCERVLVRPHPGAKGDFVSETIEALSSALSVRVQTAPCEGLVEEAFWLARHRRMDVAGLLSTALLTARLIMPTNGVHCPGSTFRRQVFSGKDGLVPALGRLGVAIH
jgi:hypothetical protein